MKRCCLLFVLVLLFVAGVEAWAAPALIDLDASKLPDGPLSSWKSTGSIAASFDVVPVGGAVVERVDGRDAVVFDGRTQRLVSSFTAPASVTGSGAYTVVAWVRNPTIEPEEAIVCWAPRGVGDGRTAQLNYGSSKDFGAVAHWGKADMGYEGGAPEAGHWHLIAVTYGGKADPVEKVYIDGKGNGAEDKALDLAAGAPVYIGCAGNEKLFSGAISAIQMYDYALSPDDMIFLAGGRGTKPNKAALVDLSAEGLPAGPLTKWQNKGTLGGSFGQIKYAPVVQDVDGRKAVSFSNGGWLQCASGLPKGAFAVELWARVNQDGAQGGAPTAALSVGGVSKDDALRLGLSREMKSGALANGKTLVGFAHKPALKTWHQIAYTYADGTLRVYVDGELDKEQKCALNVPGDVPMVMGAAWQAGKGIPYAGFDGAISKLCVYGSTLSQREIREHNGMLDAYDPVPAAGATSDKLDVTLAWETGDPATKECQVYFGTDRDEVANADKSSKCFKGKVPAEKSQSGPVKLAIGQTYYWRVDEIGSNGMLLAKGQVWQFSADPGKATVLAPRSQVSAVPVKTAKLTWNPGKFATDQTVYFAPKEDWDKTDKLVKAKLSARTGELKLPVKLDYGKTYCWRVDNANGSNPATTGDVWSFRTEDKLADNDVTFFGISDLHYSGPDSSRANQDLIRVMNAFPGNPYPSEIGGNVATPRGVICTGDVTNSGKLTEWEPFVADYGLNGDASLVYPMYELWGNHDGTTKGVVAQGIKERNPSRPNIKLISTNGFHYSWDWGKVHFTCANIYPGQVSKIVIPNDPIYSIEFIKQDLEKNVGTSGRPVVISMHYGLDGGGAGWWTEDEHEAFWNVIKNYNVIAILFGHTHGGGNYKWNGIDMVNVGASTDGGGARQFVVFHVTDKELVVARRYPDKWGQVLRKPITGMGAK